MENEKVVVLQIKLTRNRCLLLLVLAFLCFRPHIAGSETLTLTTYYPAPYGGYVSLLTTSQTLLARDGGNVGIGTGSTAPANRLQVVGGGGGTVDIRVNGRIMTGDGGNSGGVWLDGSNTMFVGQNGAKVGFWTASKGWGLMQDQAGNVELLGGNPNVAQVYGLCVQKAYSSNSITSCPQANQIVVAFWGDGNVANRITGFLPSDTIASTPWTAGTWVGFGSDFSGTMLCCRLSAP